MIDLFAFLGGDPGKLLNNFGSTGTTGDVPYEETEQERDLAEFVSVVLADTEEVWADIFRKEGLTYEEPTLVRYMGSVQSACGVAESAVGPFYCPGIGSFTSI